MEKFILRFQKYRINSFYSGFRASTIYEVLENEFYSSFYNYNYNNEARLYSDLYGYKGMHGYYINSMDSTKRVLCYHYSNSYDTMKIDTILYHNIRCFKEGWGEYARKCYWSKGTGIIYREQHIDSLLHYWKLKKYHIN